ncbi:MAG: hypothetical protein IE937_09065, partial [Gammaproteobacteria bacterium]|nr:hypothetical protein [Gammaproteobacteria bacterium]
QKAIAVLELGRAGLSVRGITPLFKDDNYIGSLDSDTQENALLVDQVACDTEQMHREMSRLVDLIDSFKIDTSKLLPKK